MKCWFTQLLPLIFHCAATDYVKLVENREICSLELPASEAICLANAQTKLENKENSRILTNFSLHKKNYAKIIQKSARFQNFQFCKKKLYLPCSKHVVPFLPKLGHHAGDIVIKMPWAAFSLLIYQNTPCPGCYHFHQCAPPPTSTILGCTSG